MSRLARFLAVAAFASMATPTYVQHVASGVVDNVAIAGLTLQLPNPALAGNCLVVCFQAPSGISAISVTDDQGGVNTWTAGPTATGGGMEAFLYYALGVAAGTRKITISWTGANDPVSGVAVEFYNVATSSAIDGSSGLSGSSGTWSAGNWSTGVDGDLIFYYATDAAGGAFGGAITAGSGFGLLVAQRSFGQIVQTEVQATHGSITPSATDTSTTYLAVAIALKAASAGTAPAAGIRVAGVTHENITGTVTTQFPATGNLRALVLIPNSTESATAVSDSTNGAYGQTAHSPASNGSSTIQIWYKGNATPAPTSTLTITQTSNPGSSLTLFDIVGAATSPYDTDNSATGTDSTHSTVNTVSITPAGANELVLWGTDQDDYTALGVSPGYFTECSWVGQNETGGSGAGDHYDLDSGTADYTTPSAAAITFAATYSGSGPGAWVALAAAFLAPAAPASVALSGTATASITKADVVAGGKTIVLTVTNGTWIT